MPPDLYLVIEKTQQNKFCFGRQKDQIVAASAEAKVSGGWHELPMHFWLLGQLIQAYLALVIALEVLGS